MLEDCTFECLDPDGYRKQGQVIGKSYEGGWALGIWMEDVDIIRRIGRANMDVLNTHVVTSADRFRRGGWWGRPIRNMFCLALYFLRVPPRILVRLYR